MADRAKGVTLRLMSVDGIAEEALERFNGLRLADEKPATQMRVGWEPYGVLVRGDRLWVVNNEGVGSEITDEKPLVIDLYPQWESSFAMMPALEARLTPAEVLDRCGDVTVDLSEHIRSFGARLEQNFWTWHRIAMDATVQEATRGA